MNVKALVGTFYKMTLETVSVITDGALTIEFSAEAGNAFVSGIEVNLVGPHLAHAVASGPYTGVDVFGGACFPNIFILMLSFLSHLTTSPFRFNRRLCFGPS